MKKIVIAGAGSVGCYVGAVLADAGRDVTVLVRRGRFTHISLRGIRVSDLDGRNRLVTADQVHVDTAPETTLAAADLVLVCVKRGDTAGIAADIAQHAPPTAVVLSLQNGIGNDKVLAPVVAPRTALPGVVMFNAVLADADPGVPLVAHRATSGGLLIPEGHETVRAALAVPGLEVIVHPDMRAAGWGKLLLNLNNAINALSGLPLAQQLARRDWRRVLADQQAEALAVLAASGIKPARVGAVRPQLVPHILRLPDVVFRLLAAKMLAIDPGARSSMWEDLDRRRTTEIDYLQGEVLKLAQSRGLAVPVTERLIALVRAAEAAKAGSPHMTATQVRLG